MKKRMLLSAGLALTMLVTGFFSTQVVAQSKSKKDDPVRLQLAKMRGKLLYKRSQIRKLEKAACDSNPELKKKVDELEKERRTQFIAADVKLEPLYNETDVMQSEIQKLSDSVE